MVATGSKNRFDRMFSKRESALDWIVFLTNDNEADRKTIGSDDLKRAVQFISPADYEDEILIERNMNNLCGYPICLEVPKEKTIVTPIRRNPRNSSYPKDTAESSSTWKTVTSTISANQPQEPRFCSEKCQARSDYYLTRILKNPSLRSRNTDNHIGNTNDDARDGASKIVLLEDLDQFDNRPATHSNTLTNQQAVPLDNGPASDEDQQTKPKHDFLEPLLTQLQSHNKAKWVDKNLNPIFSSIRIIEHPPQAILSSSSTSIPLAPHPSNDQDPDQRFFKPSTFSDCPLTGASVNLLKSDQDLNPIHELSPVLIQTLTSQAIHSNSNPHRSLGSKTRPHDDHDTLPSAFESEAPIPGLLEAEIIYNVGSVEDQYAIDQAMALRDQLGLQST
ncbi:hypothetical protein PtA15_2A848 [Puccinia triticina]|uniref:RNA polymerase II subunit B1 CTD phosphatase RPAP2 homolog n=1 Tax=Puccinia triticina TaxID=208348 RepID=A0ABY7CBE9_9BASI|nr:uncharacterized protein PtA15_2A848 [Puccinia triticina]WAQ82531.1 hypothetical protein PtA15_2A848 [Puccinia triticina]